jgi:hypothetical protein
MENKLLLEEINKKINSTIDKTPTMKLKLLFLFSTTFFLGNLFSQSVCCEKPIDVWLTYLDCSRTSNYDKLKLLLPPNGMGSGDAYMMCNPGKEFNGQALPKKDFTQMYIDYRNLGFPKVNVEYLKKYYHNGIYYPAAKVGFLYVVFVNGCWYFLDS